MTAAAIARALPKGCKSGTSYVACCPAHKDRNPSLSIRDTADAQVLVHCHAGCTQGEVVEALKARGLWPKRNCDQKPTIIDEYNYTDEAGTLLYQVVRYYPKDFRPRYPDGRGGWILKKHPRQVLYRLGEVLEAPICFCVEGEKDVESLRCRGFVATTNAGGAQAPWLNSYTQTLAGREVIIIPDNDPPGWRHAKAIAKALLGHAARIILLDDIHRRGCKDITEWFERGHSECELIAVLEGINAV